MPERLSSLTEADLDCHDDVFDPPAWRPGRFLQFADLACGDEGALRPVSLTRAHHGDCVLQIPPSTLSPHPLRLSPRTTLLMTSCVAVALTALTLLTFAI